MADAPETARTPETARISVVIPCYTEKRWDALVAAVRSAQAQEPAPAEVVLVVDYNDALLERAQRHLPEVTVLANRYTRGVSGARNTGVEHTSTPLVALLDDDGCARPGWLAGLAAPFADPRVIGTGGAISPVWEVPRPGWFPDEFLWVVAASDMNKGPETVRVRNVWGASVAVRRDAFDAAGGFRLDFTRQDDAYRAEDTDLCLRMTEATGGTWMYVPTAVIDHPVPAARARVGYLVTRSYHEGRGKVGMARYNKGGSDALDLEKDYLRREIPRAVARGFAGTLRGRGLAPAARSCVMMLGIAAAAFGGLVELARGRRQHAPQAAGQAERSGQGARR
ncbi:glycosyltransferase family 2 protein [Longispora albida]|uniref:glycosyltransferase family 2 protein n=1 Tax=Longispora albida TaxID=203523 RepID=UPI00037C78C7|nr:glycosyltransferase [Longispora albida]